MLQVRCALAVRVQAACGAYKLAGRRRCCHRRTAGRQAGTPRRQIAAGMQSTDLLQNGGRQRLRHLHMGRADKRVLEGGAQNSTATAADGAAVPRRQAGWRLVRQVQWPALWISHCSSLPDTSPLHIPPPC